jgi:cob(I)alamin adenosyltransferase
MRITKVYTKGGDAGETSLVGGERVKKNHPRIGSYGSVDELNAVVGIVRTLLVRSEADDESKSLVDGMLNRIQNDLFNVGADLATPAGHRWEGMIRVDEESILQLERWIDQLNEVLPPLREFILPGGGMVGSFLHQARTVCRRAERDVLDLMEHDTEVGVYPMKYLNRLSDFLFVAGRWVAAELGEPEHFWSR